MKERSVKLPDLKSAYLEHPSEGMVIRGKNGEVRKFKTKTGNAKIMCGICGVKHVPGEPHAARSVNA
jgi:hypothetical protein